VGGPATLPVQWAGSEGLRVSGGAHVCASVCVCVHVGGRCTACVVADRSEDAGTAVQAFVGGGCLLSLLRYTIGQPYGGGLIVPSLDCNGLLTVVEVVGAGGEGPPSVGCLGRPAAGAAGRSRDQGPPAPRKGWKDEMICAKSCREVLTHVWRY